MRLIRQGGVSLRIEDVYLALAQTILAEAYATRRLLWESLVMPQLPDAGIDANELELRFAYRKTNLPENNQRTRHLSFDEEDRLFAKLTGERDYLRALVTVEITPDRGVESC